MQRMQIRSGIFILALVAVVVYLFASGQETWAIFLGCLMGVALVIFLVFQAMDRRKEGG